MELITSPQQHIEDIPWEEVSTGNAFITANTVECALSEIRDHHIIPVFVKDNEPLISHLDFIEAASYVAGDVFAGNHILKPSVRVSHPVKGRIPEARNKPAAQLLDHEKTLYYERMAFCIEVPTITDVVAGNRLSLTIGGVKAYNLDNLSNKKGADEHFKVFIGFKNTVCTNLCVWSDGFVGDLKVKNLGQLQAAMFSLFRSFSEDRMLEQLKQLTNYELTEHQFATLLGRARMYQHLSYQDKQQVPALLFGDQQLGSVCKDYYRDAYFSRNEKGDISLWRFYNLFTGANKSTYIDQFLDRSVNALSFVEQIKDGLDGKDTNWYLN